jgi:hypothetical protein
VLQPGSRVGPYEIGALLGEGGMGQVYRARDPRLGRDVALKIIATGHAVDAGQQRRFEQEAHAAAALSHPNILAVHDVGFHEGMPYIVAELLEGVTLRERIAAGPIPVRKAVEFATQMARALAAAHERKIVHRDLKPENIFVLRDGRIKILDFGLAKLTAEGGEQSASQMATAEGVTTPGTVMGTVGYMSPEQVRAEAVDHRTDIFALGAILYEMLTGRRAFGGRTAADTMTAVLREDPPPLSGSGSGVQVPAAVERIIGYCLEKDASLRLQSAHDLAIALEATVGSASAADAPPVPRQTRRRRTTTAAAVLALALAAAGYGAGRWSAPRTALPEFTRLTFQPNVGSARFLPEQTGVIYTVAPPAQSGRLVMARLGSPEFSTLGEPGLRLAGVAPNGELAVLRNITTSPTLLAPLVATLARMPATGGAPRDVLEGVNAAEWGPDGDTFVVVRPVDGRHRLEYPIGNVLFETTGWIDAPRVSPDGQRVAFAEHPIIADDRGWVVVADVTTKHAARLTVEQESLRGIAWHPLTEEIYFAGKQRIDAIAKDGTVRTAARSTESNSLQDVARDGRLLVSYSTAEIRTRLVLPSGELRDVQWLDRTVPIAFWPDGDRLLFWEAAEYGVYSRSLDASPAVRLGDGMGLALSADGRRALAVQPADPMRLVVYPTGAGETRLLPTPGIQRIFRGVWTPDGAGIVFAGEEQGSPVRLYTQKLTEGAPRRIGTDGLTLPFSTALVTPDGAAVLASTPDHDFVLVPLDGSETKPAKALRARDLPLGWEPDALALIVGEAGSEWPVKLVRVDLDRGTRTTWREISMPDVARTVTVPIALSRDRRTIAFSTQSARTTLYMVSFPDAE